MYIVQKATFLHTHVRKDSMASKAVQLILSLFCSLSFSSSVRFNACVHSALRHRYVSVNNSGHTHIHTLTGDDFFIVLHEACEPEVGPVFCVRHFLQTSECSVGLRVVELV